MTDQEYDPRYLAGIMLFNRGDFFEAHEVWEDLWMEVTSDDRQFYQGLIQAAVGLCHFCNGNVRGAVKLYHSSRDYLDKYPSPYHGLDLEEFWRQMQRCFDQLLDAKSSGSEIKEDLIPIMELEPVPEQWPNPAEFLDDE